jgi:hypothetical protein
MSDAPIIYRWSGEAMEPLPRFAKLCDATFVVGEVYRLVEHHERSSVSHRHYFACVHSAWENLPEQWADRLPTSEHLRKYALIRTGYRDERSIVAASKAEAQRIAAFVKPLDDFAVVLVSEAQVTVYTAKSQSVKAMGRTEFQASKVAVLDFCADLIGVATEQLTKAAT